MCHPTQRLFLFVVIHTGLLSLAIVTVLFCFSIENDFIRVFKNTSRHTLAYQRRQVSKMSCPILDVNIFKHDLLYLCRIYPVDFSLLKLCWWMTMNWWVNFLPLLQITLRHFLFNAVCRARKRCQQSCCPFYSVDEFGWYGEYFCMAE